MDSLQHQIALTLLPHIGPVTAKSLTNYCGSATAVFKASKRELLKIPGIGAAALHYLQRPEALLLAEKEMRFLEDHGVEALFYTDARYPYRLLQCFDAPVLIYFKGSDLQLLNADKVIAIVGTRQRSAQAPARTPA